MKFNARKIVIKKDLYGNFAIVPKRIVQKKL